MLKVTGVWLYPLKSGAPLPVLQLQLGPLGLDGDRIAMVVDTKGRQVTARECPPLLTVCAEPSGRGLDLTAPGRPAIFARPGRAVERVALWSETISTHPASPAVDRWLSEVAGRPVRLVFTAPRHPRPDPEGRTQGLGDVAVLHIVSEASLAALNARLLVPLPVLRFRPNLIFSGAPAFDEDGWGELRIGEATLRILGPAERCVLTTIGPETLAPDPGAAPLAQLARFRSRGQAIDFGVYATVLAGGTVAVGDRVEVLRRRPAHVYAQQPAPVPGTRRLFRLVETGAAGASSRHLWLEADDGAPPPAVMPGQFVVLHLPLPGGEVTRCYTVSGQDGRRLRITVRAMGQVSRWLSAAPPGQSFWSGGVAGDMTLPPEGPLVLLTAGSGITPALAMTAAAAPGRPIRHVHSERRRADVADLEVLARKAATDPAYSFTLIETSVQGRAMPAGLATLPPGTTVILCGPDAYCAAIRGILPGHVTILSETFSAPAQPAVTGPVKTFRVEVDGVSFAARSDQTVLAAAEEAGVELPASCRAGLCRTCQCRLIEGQVLAPPAAPGLPASCVLACVSRPAGDPAAGPIKLARSRPAG